MSNSKKKQYRVEEREYWDGEKNYKRTKEEKMRNKRKERHIEHALKTLDIDELIAYEEDFE